jgi:hypothetical protein
MTESRKRIRSGDDEFGLQTKYFVNQQLVDKNSANRMKIVYGESLAGLKFIVFNQIILITFINF